MILTLTGVSSSIIKNIPKLSSISRKLVRTTNGKIVSKIYFVDFYCEKYHKKLEVFSFEEEEEIILCGMDILSEGMLSICKSNWSLALPDYLE